jgi:hypothetical protein
VKLLSAGILPLVSGYDAMSDAVSRALKRYLGKAQPVEV